MRVYFLSAVPAALKLDGQYAGIIDLFERYAEIDEKKGAFAEIVPDGNLQPLNFILDEKFFSAPPAFADVYIMGNDRLIRISGYAAKSSAPQALAQKRLGGALVTIFRQGGIYAACEGAEFALHRLPEDFSDPECSVERMCGREFIAVRGGKFIALFSEEGRLAFLNRAESCSFGEKLKITLRFETCTRARASFEFGYDGQKFVSEGGATEETRPPEEEILPFAFFQSVLTRGDCAAYLSDELRPKAGALRAYLGEFTDVLPPLDEKYGAAAGLVYPRGGNLYEVKYFYADAEGGKVVNIRPAD